MPHSQKKPDKGARMPSEDGKLNSESPPSHTLRSRKRKSNGDGNGIRHR